VGDGLGNHDKRVMPSPICLSIFRAYKNLVTMKANPACRVCGIDLTEENWYPSNQKRNQHVCKECQKEPARLWRKANPEKLRVQQLRAVRKRGVKPFDENKDCPLYLGVHVAERVLSHVFENVERMPYRNPWFDFICNKGKKVDVKSSCIHKSGAWNFNIKHNTTADYFLCLAFDNREDLNPLHVWLIPGSKLNHSNAASITQSISHKWEMYELDISKISACCDAMK